MERRKRFLGGGGAVYTLLVWLGVLVLGNQIVSAQSKTLSGHVPSVTKYLTATGTLPETNRLNLAIGLPLRNAAKLESLLKRLYDPASLDYRHYLTPEQFTEQFGPTPADYAAVTAFAQKNHLTVRATHGNRVLLDVSGTVADIQKAFQVTLKVYHHPAGTRNFFAPDREPTVDATLPIADVDGLSSFSPPRPQSLNIESLVKASGSPGSGSGPNGAYIGNDFRAAYLPGVTLTGAGQTIGLLEFDGYYPPDIAAYETNAGLPSVPLQNVSVDGTSNSVFTMEGDTEVSLDIELAIAMAPGLSQVVVFEGETNSPPNDLLDAMAAHTNISQFSSSWAWSGGPTTTTDNIFRQMIAQGQSYFNAAGDFDAFTMGTNSPQGVDSVTFVGSPCSSPYVTEVGGTVLTTTGPGGAWAGETVWNLGFYNGAYTGSSGGVSSYYGIPAWQTNVSMTSNGGSPTNRNLPDVAMTAHNVNVIYGNGQSATVGGTSCATPLWAALAALLNQQSLAAGRPVLGFLNPSIYAVGTGAGYASAFHDITTGNNEWPGSPLNYSAVAGYDLCSGWGSPAGQSLINALAGTTDLLHISPTTGFIAAGHMGGPFTNSSQIFTLSNTGSNTLPWSIGHLPAWLSVTPGGGVLTASNSVAVTVSLNSTAASLLVETNLVSLSVTNLTSGVIQSLPVILQVSEPLVIAPGNGFTESGLVGGPFAAATNLTLSNPASIPVKWSLGGLPAWLNLTPTNGTVAAGGATVLTAGVNTFGLALPGGVYTATLPFADITGQTTQSLALTLQVGQSIVLNGGFETGDFSDWTLVGDTVIGGLFYNSVETTNAFPDAVHSGNYGALMGDTMVATLSQNLATVPGQTYQLSFWIDNPQSGTNEIFLAEWITNSMNASPLFGITNPPVLAWTNITQMVTAAGTNTELQFGVENDVDFFGLDDITVTPIPNPAIRTVTTTGNFLNLTLYTVAGLNYELLYATNLTQSAWLPLSTNTAAAATLTITNALGTNAQGFYRIFQVP